MVSCGECERGGALRFSLLPQKPARVCRRLRRPRYQARIPLADRCRGGSRGPPPAGLNLQTLMAGRIILPPTWCDEERLLMTAQLSSP